MSGATMQVETLVPIDDFWDGEMRVVDVQGTPVLLINIADRIVAFEDKCPHKGVPLSRGTLANGKILTCSAHHWVFDACEGCGVNPASARLNFFNVRRIGENGLAISKPIAERAGHAG